MDKLQGQFAKSSCTPNAHKGTTADSLGTNRRHHCHAKAIADCPAEVQPPTGWAAAALAWQWCSALKPCLSHCTLRSAIAVRPPLCGSIVVWGFGGLPPPSIRSF
jgi:hypothetical protein